MVAYEDLKDAECSAVDPAIGTRRGRSSGVGRFETEMLSQRHNLIALMNLSGQ